MKNLKINLQSKWVFWIRFLIYVIFAGLLPFLFLVFKFDLFKETTKLSIGGWGIISIIFIAIFFITLIKEVRAGMPFSFKRQCLDGLKTIIPLIAVALCLYEVKEFIDDIIEFIVVVTICQCVAIPANPLKKWRHDNNLDENDGLVARAAEIFWSKKK